MRAFPLSNWTELDIWLYIYREKIPVPSLYFAAERPVVERDGALVMVDDDRLPLRDGEAPALRLMLSDHIAGLGGSTAWRSQSLSRCWYSAPGCCGSGSSTSCESAAGVGNTGKGRACSSLNSASRSG